MRACDPGQGPDTPRTNRRGQWLAGGSLSVAVGLLLKPLPVADEAHLQVFWSDFNWRGVEFDFVKERLVAAHKGDPRDAPWFAQPVDLKFDKFSDVMRSGTTRKAIAAHVMEEMRQAAQLMNNANINSCETAQALVGGIWPQMDSTRATT